MKEKIGIKHRREIKKDMVKRPLKYDATFDEILDLVVGSDKKLSKKAHRLAGLR